MSNRATIVLAIGMLVLGLVLGAVGGGAMGFFVGRDFARAANPVLQGLRQPIQPGQAPVNPPGGFQPPQNFGNAAARVTQVEKDSPADKAGVQQGDLITAIGGTKLDATHSLADLIGAKKPGDKVDLAITRGNQNLAVTATLSGAPQDASKAYLGVFYAPIQPDNQPRRRQQTQ